MLPDTVHKLPREERYAYARLLAFMARVDNELTVDEMAMFEQRLGTALLSPNQRQMIRSALKTPPTLEECLSGLGPEAGRLALRDATLMAAADGTVDEDERDVLQTIVFVVFDLESPMRTIQSRITLHRLQKLSFTI